MRRIWSNFLTLAFLFGFGLSSGTCIAQPAIDAATVLQICEAFLKHAPEQMPAIVSPEASKKFFETYNFIPRVLEEKLDGCLSASETKRDSNAATFLIQNTRYESYWVFATDEKSIKEISIEQFRPVTLAEDEEWEDPFGAVLHMYPSSNFSVVPAGPTTDPNIVEFFYATNRKELDALPSLNPQANSTTDDLTLNGWTAVSDYTGERNAELSFGAVRVRVPEGHSEGRLELPSNSKIFRLVFSWKFPDPTKYFTIRSIEKTDEDAWMKSLSSMKGKKALLYVHGFNTKFRDSVFRTAQIVWDLKFHGTAVLFSWPSRGEIADYFYDRESALSSREALLHVVADLHKAGFDDINVIAHSMGNLIAVDALANSAATPSPEVIAQLVMAAPDVDRDMFMQEIPKVATVAKGLTLYASKNDKALHLSKRVAGDIPRAGDVPASGPVVMASLATIDVSAIGNELFGLNHNVFATTRNVLNDIKLLLETGAPPPRLAEIHGYPEPPERATYFRYVP